MQKIKGQEGISLGILIIIVVALMVAVGVGIAIVKNSGGKNTVNEHLTNVKNQENIGLKNQENKASENKTELSVAQIKQTKYPETFGKDGFEMYPPQSYICHNTLSINPKKNERFVVTSATSRINTSYEDTLSAVYIVDEKKEVKVEVRYINSTKLKVYDNINGTDIYVLARYNNTNLKSTRYILLSGVANYESNASYKCYIVLEPNYEIQNKDILEISKNIIIDKTRGEYLNNNDGYKLIADKESMKKKIGNITFDFNNVMVTSWSIGLGLGSSRLGAGNNEIRYYVKENGKYIGTELKLPIGLYSVKTDLKTLKESIESSNSTAYKQELEEIEIKQHKMYALKGKTANGSTYYTDLYIELEGNKLASFTFDKVKDINSLKTMINNRILNKVLFYE